VILIDVTAKADFVDAVFLNHDCAVVLQEIIFIIHWMFGSALLYHSQVVLE
jgi:hypothetical protein